MAAGINLYQDFPDSPTALKDHYISKEIFEPVMREMAPLSNFSIKEKITGQSITIPNVKEIELIDATIAQEVGPMTKSKIEFNGKTADLERFGHVIEYSKEHVMRNEGVVQVKPILAKQLQADMAYQLEKQHKDALDTGQVCFIPTGSGAAVLDTDGTPSTAAANNLSLYHFRYLKLLASDTYQIPKLKSLGGYAYFSRGETFFSIQNDPQYQALNQGVPQSMQKFFVAQLYGINLFHTPEESLFLNNIGTNQDVAEGVLLGEGAMHMFYNKPFSISLDEDNKAYNAYGRIGQLWYNADLNVITPKDTNLKREVRHIRVTSS